MANRVSAEINFVGISIEIPIETNFDFQLNYWLKLWKVIGISISTVRIKFPISYRNRNFDLFWFKMFGNFDIDIKIRNQNRNSDVGVGIPMSESEFRCRNQNAGAGIEIAQLWRMCVPPSDLPAGLVVKGNFCHAEGPGSKPAQDKNLHLGKEVIFQ
jgi:hypothetical protein